MPQKPSTSKDGEQDDNNFLPEGKSGPPMLDDLTAEHKRKNDQVMADLGKEFLKQYTWTRNGGIRYIGDPESALSGVDLSVPSEERNQALRQEINYMIHHAIIR